MAVSRAAVVDGKFIEHVRALPPGAPCTDLNAPLRGGARLTGLRALELFQAQITSRLCDLLARDLKGRGEAFYTIGGSGHEGNAAVAAALRPDDPAFLHYRSGGFYLARAQQVPGPRGVRDIILGLVASADEHIAGGRHKVFGSLDLAIPPQTSTIASQLPKALGMAVAMDRLARLEKRKEDRVVVCTFGDASSNHSTATGTLNAAGWTTIQKIPAPLLLVCEDNGFGISVRTPTGWIAQNYATRAGITYFKGDGLDLIDAYEAACKAADFVRTQRQPAFLHLRTVRLLGHAGSDVEQLYRTPEEIEQAEALDPVLASAKLLVAHGVLTPEQIIELYEATRARLYALGEEAITRPKLTTREQVMQPLLDRRPPQSLPVPSSEQRAASFRNRLPEASDRPRHLAFQLNRGLRDLLLSVPRAIIFGEDVARKGGVYHVTADLSKDFSVGRVFNTLLDEQSILGLAIGAGHAGMLPLPEIQYLAYLMNAIDQLRGEAGSMQFFSNNQYSNPMVVRIAGLAYQKGFGGHFHNDNGIAALREVPGLLIGCPSRGDDAVAMLRTLAACALQRGRVTVLLEPIALYMTKDLYEDGDGLWNTLYPAPDKQLELDTVRTYGNGTDLCIVSYANGLWMSLRVAKRLEAEGYSVRVVDLQWLSPLPLDALEPEARAAGKLLIVDECRANSGIADSVAAEMYERIPGVRIKRVTGADTYIPLGAAANLVLVQEHDIEAGARALLEAK